MTLRTGTELSTLSLLLNKVSGLYGLLALLTGFHLSSLQLSMYIYSVLALILVAYLAPHIRTQKPLECLALASFFVLDGVVNALWTVAFGIAWFMVLSEHHTPDSGAGRTMSDAAGFTSPEHNVSSVDVVVGPDQGMPGQRPQAVTAGHPPLQGGGARPPSWGHGILQSESLSSILVICALWAVRFYFILVVMSYTKLVLRRHVAAGPRTGTAIYTGGKSASRIEDPFAVHLPEGRGWKGRLGRCMIGISRQYWLGVDEEDEGWRSDEAGLKWTKKREAGAGEVPGVVERERRRRSGTVC